MYTPDFSNSGFMYEERLRDAERQRAHNKLVESALEHRKAEGYVSLLSQIAQRLHVKPQRTDIGDKRDTRQVHAV